MREFLMNLGVILIKGAINDSKTRSKTVNKIMNVVESEAGKEMTHLIMENLEKKADNGITKDIVKVVRNGLYD